MADSATLDFRCDSCRQAYRVKPDLAGRKIKCKCGHIMRVPQPAPAAASQIVDLSPDDDIGLSEHAAHMTAQCPACGNRLPPSAVLCVLCGYNLKTGQKLGQADPNAKPIKEKRSREKKPSRGAGSDVGGSAFFLIVKILNWIIVGFIALGLIGSFMSGDIVPGLLGASILGAAAATALKVTSDPPGSSGERIGGYVINTIVFLGYGVVFLIILIGLAASDSVLQEMSPEDREMLGDAPIGLALGIAAIIVGFFPLTALLNIIAIFKAGRD